MPSSQDIKNYENSNEMAERLYDMLVKEYAWDFKKRYVQSLMNYLGESEFGDLWIDFHYQKTRYSISMSSFYGCNQDKPYFLTVYKQIKNERDVGGHEMEIHFDNRPNDTSLDFENIKQKLNKFLGIKQKYEQLTLF